MGAVLHHARGQALCEGLVSIVQLVEHGIALPPADQADGVGVNPRQEDHHGASCAEGSGASVNIGESDRWAGVTENGANYGGDIFTAGYMHLPLDVY